MLIRLDLNLRITRVMTVFKENDMIGFLFCISFVTM